MRKIWLCRVVLVSSALLLCIIGLPVQAQQSQTIKTETELILALVKTSEAPNEITNLLHTNASLVTDNLWESLMTLTAQRFYENPNQAFRLYDLAREVALQLKDQKRLAKTYYQHRKIPFGGG
jgi:hypothetical protein